MRRLLPLLLPLAALAQQAEPEEEATDWIPRLYGDYTFLFHNTEYTDPPVARSDERSHLRQTFELGARWEFSETVSLEAGLELEHDIADSLESFSSDWDSFKLHPRLRLGVDFAWGGLDFGHLSPTPHPATVYPAPYEQPPVGLSFAADLDWITMELWAARISRVGEDTKETFIASGVFEYVLFPGLSLPLVMAYRHAGGYDTADYAEYSPPDGVRKDELLNVAFGARLLAESPLVCFRLGAGALASRGENDEGLGLYAQMGVGGSCWSLDGEFYLSEDGYRGVHPRADLFPAPLAYSDLDPERETFWALAGLEGRLFTDIGPAHLWGGVRFDYTIQHPAGWTTDSPDEEYHEDYHTVVELGATLSF